MHIHTVLGHLFGPDTGLAWGLSIVLLVVAIRICLIPLFVKQVHAQRKMAQGDKQRLNEETMKFYKENGVNPLAGCLPMIPQMIVFFALFSVLRAIAGWNGKTALPYGLTLPVVKSAQKATIFGVNLGDKFTSLFAHPSLSPRVAIVIALTVVVSASTTFMTVRQSAKRGLMQTNVDPGNPMAQSQKYMMYVVPFFSLTGLYWVYGLVLYWATTNLWALGQQLFMFGTWTVEPTGAPGATAAATTGATARTAQSSPRQASGTKTGAAKTSAGGARTGSATTRPGSSAAQVKRSGTASSGSSASSGARPVNAGNGSTAGTNRSGGTRTGSARGDAMANTASVPANRPNGGEKRGLLRLGRPKREPEPEPEPEVPAAKVVRQQPVRQAKSKRSGKR